MSNEMIFACGVVVGIIFALVGVFIYVEFGD